jgi:hypothetical protein
MPFPNLSIALFNTLKIFSFSAGEKSSEYCFSQAQFWYKYIFVEQVGQTYKFQSIFSSCHKKGITCF